MADKPYRDPKTTKIEDWKWRPLENIKAELALKEIPDYIQKGFGGFMTEQAGRSQRGEMSPRDLLKAYTIAQSSIGRGGLSHATATKTGMRLPDTGGEVRPEGSYSEWLGSPAGQKYLDAAERGQINHEAINDLRGKFAPFGKQNDQAEKMAYAAMTIPGMAEHLNEALTGSTDEYRDFAEKLKGIAGAKSGFIGSLLGRGDLPTLDARQLNLHTDESPVGVGSMMNRGKGKGAREAVERLASRQAAMGFDIDPSLKPHYQHLAHHAVWDKTSGTETTHDDLMRAMRGYAQGGDVNPTTEQMRQALDHYAKGGSAEKEAALPLNLPRAPNMPAPEMQAHVDRIVRQQLGEHVSQPGKTTNLSGRSKREAERIKGVSYGLRPTGTVAPSSEYQGRVGDINIALPGDQTIADTMLEHVGGKPIESQQEGGARYGAGKMHLPEDERAFWASGEQPAQMFQNKVTELARLTGEEPRIIAHHLAMGRIANNFAQHFADANLKAIESHMVEPENIEQFNQIIRMGYEKLHPKSKKRMHISFPEFPGVENPDEAYMAMQKNPELRKWFNNRMKTPNITQALGMPSGLDVEYAISEPALRNMEINLTGHSVGKMRPGASLRPGSKHRTYSHDILGEALGHAAELAPLDIQFPDASAHIRREYAPKDFTGTMQKVFPHQVVDPQHLDQMAKYYEMVRKTRGFAEGGEIDAGPTHDEMLAHIMLHKAGGGAVQPDAPDGMSSDNGYYEGGPSDMSGMDPMQYRAAGGSIKPSNVGVEEAPDMPVKLYMPPGGEGEQGMPVGGVDFQPEAPGHQLSLAPQGQPGQPPQGAQAPQGMPPQGALGQPPQGQPQGPRSNILQMTQQGQAMAAMRATPPQPAMPRMAEGGSTTPSVEEMRRAIAGAAKSAGMKEPVVANKQLTNMQDFHTSLGDKIRARAMDMQDMVESMPFKYDKGHRVFTDDSAKKNKAPYTIVRRVPFGNQVVREEGTLRTVKDPQTGKAMRTPYEPGYHVRHEEGDDWSEFHIPESAIKGRVKMAGGGRVSDIDIEERPL